MPDLAVLLLIDGSGSMYGIRRGSAMKSSVILHEVLKKQGICHAIVEHRGCFDEPQIDINILVDFNAREDDPGSFDCYDTLKHIYPKIISCNDLKRLTGQLLAVVSKQLQ